MWPPTTMPTFIVTHNTGILVVIELEWIMSPFSRLHNLLRRPCLARSDCHNPSV